jgi:hypothetical protein
LRKGTPPEASTADEFEELMLEPRRPLVVWTQLVAKPDDDEPKAARPAE